MYQPTSRRKNTTITSSFLSLRHIKPYERSAFLATHSPFILYYAVGITYITRAIHTDAMEAAKTNEQRQNSFNNDSRFDPSFDPSLHEAQHVKEVIPREPTSNIQKIVEIKPVRTKPEILRHHVPKFCRYLYMNYPYSHFDVRTKNVQEHNLREHFRNIMSRVHDENIDPPKKIHPHNENILEDFNIRLATAISLNNSHRKQYQQISRLTKSRLLAKSDLIHLT